MPTSGAISTPAAVDSRAPSVQRPDSPALANPSPRSRGSVQDWVLTMRASAASHAEAARPQPPALPARQLRRSHGAPWQGCLKRGLALEQLRSDSLYLPRRKTQAFLEELLVVLERNDAIAEPAEFGVLIHPAIRSAGSAVAMRGSTASEAGRYVQLAAASCEGSWRWRYVQSVRGR